MARDFYINGESLVLVKGRSDSAIGSLSQLGLASDPITVSPGFKHKDINVNAWGEAPADVQWMLSDVNVSMTLMHFDSTVLATCWQLSMGGSLVEGQMGRAGQRMGNNQARFTAATGSPATGNNSGNNYIGLNIASPVQGTPWRFFYAYLAQPPFRFPLGVEKSAVTLNWRVIPYTQDPYNGGLGAYAYPLWDHTLDT